MWLKTWNYYLHIWNCVCVWVVLWMSIIFWTFIALINWDTLYDKELETNWNEEEIPTKYMLYVLNSTSLQLCVCVCVILCHFVWGCYRFYSRVYFLSIQVTMWTLYYYFGMIMIHTHEFLFLNDKNKHMKLGNPNHTWTSLCSLLLQNIFKQHYDCQSLFHFRYNCVEGWLIELECIWKFALVSHH